MTPDLPPVTGLLETGLYVEDVARSRAFHTRLFGFPVLVEDDRLCALDVEGRGVLLLFRRGGATETVHIPGGAIPGHDGNGTLHYAFAIAPGQLEPWTRRLESEGIEIESRVIWPRGASASTSEIPMGTSWSSLRRGCGRLTSGGWICEAPIRRGALRVSPRTAAPQARRAPRPMRFPNCAI